MPLTNTLTMEADSQHRRQEGVLIMLEEIPQHMKSIMLEAEFHPSATEAHDPRFLRCFFFH